jgi:streptogramin lyase
VSVHVRTNLRVRAVAAVVAAAVALPFASSSGAASGGTTGSERGQVPADPKVDYFFVDTPSHNGRPFWIAPGPDGNMWFTDTAGNVVGEITMQGEVTVHRVGKGKTPYAIVTGPDGNLWFTENTANRVGVVNPQGQLIHEYNAPGSDPRPTGISVAPDGAVWFAASTGGETVENNLGRIDAEGNVESIELFPCSCFATGVTFGPDGNMWATEELGVSGGSANGTIDRITADGKTVDRFPMPIEEGEDQGLPAFIAPGPDGNVWFTAFAASRHRIGRVTPDGDITEFVVPGGPSSSAGIATGPDGRLWVAQSDAHRIWIVRPNGTFVTDIPTHQQPSILALGPDGNIWFTAALDREIGRIRIARPGHRYVLRIASGFVPGHRVVPPGTTVHWVLEAPGMQGVRDTTGIGLYDSGRVPPVAFEEFRFTVAGSYPFRDGFRGALGRIDVPVQLPDAGRVGRELVVRWASGRIPDGFVADLRIRRPGDHSFSPWITGTRTAQRTFTPREDGRYAFTARLREVAGGADSGWSPPRAVEVA